MHDTSWSSWLGGRVAGIDRDRMPPHIIRHARYVWLDTVGVILAGSLEPEVSALAAAVATPTAPPNGAATVIRPGLPSASVEVALLQNGIAGTTLELDEGHRPTGHPAMYTLPAVLAVAESIGASGAAVLEGLVAGYEVAARLAAAVSWREEVHVHGALAGVAAAAGVARVMQCSPTETDEAIRAAASMGIASPFAAAREGALVRNAFAGVAAMVGLWSVRLATSGFGGPLEGLDQVYTGVLGTDIRLEDLTRSGDDEYLIASNYFKVHAACRYLHSAIDATTGALGGRQMTEDSVERIRVLADANALRCGVVAPESSLAAKFSLPYAVAARIVTGGAGPEAFGATALDDPSIRALAERVSIEEHPALAADGRWPTYPASVEILLLSGERLVGTVHRPRGDQPEPIAYEEIEEKFLAVTRPAFQAGMGRDAIGLLLQFDQISDLRELMGSLGTLLDVT